MKKVILWLVLLVLPTMITKRVILAPMGSDQFQSSTIQLIDGMDIGTRAVLSCHRGIFSLEEVSAKACPPAIAHK
jgi:hypothetical protein